MIAAELTLGALVRIAAPVIWRNDREIARKLEEFSATEAGSALDMLKAAELAEDPRLRRLFFVHAMDEARHARMFRELARRLDPESGRRLSETARIHARRQNLFQKLGLVAFLGFVHLAEKRGEAHFRALRKHFAGRPELERLFERIAQEEKFHVRYSLRALRELAAHGGTRGSSAAAAHGAGAGAADVAPGAQGPRAGAAAGALGRMPALPSATAQGLELGVAGVLARVRLKAAWDAWRRAGRRLGELTSRFFLAILYFLVLPPFVLAQRLLEPERTGWKLASPRRRKFLPGRQF